MGRWRTAVYIGCMLTREALGRLRAAEPDLPDEWVEPLDGAGGDGRCVLHAPGCFVRMAGRVFDASEDLRDGEVTWDEVAGALGALNAARLERVGAGVLAQLHEYARRSSGDGVGGGAALMPTTVGAHVLQHRERGTSAGAGCVVQNVRIAGFPASDDAAPEAYSMSPLRARGANSFISQSAAPDFMSDLDLARLFEGQHSYYRRGGAS